MDLNKIKDIVCKIEKQLWAVVTTNDWYLDIYKIIGIVCICIAIILGFRVFAIVKEVDSAKLGVLAGVAVMVGGYSTILFAQSAKNDRQPNQPPNTPVQHGKMPK